MTSNGRKLPPQTSPPATIERFRRLYSSVVYWWLCSLVVRASDLRLIGREFDQRPPHYRSVDTGMGDRLRAGIPSLYVTSHRGKLSPLPSVGREKSTGQNVVISVLYQHSRTSPLSSNELLKQLHWLPIEWHIRFKLANMTFEALHTDRPPYLSDHMQHHEPTKSLRSSSSHQLLVPRHKLTFWISCFSVFCSKSLEFITCQYS